jgi:hypothetical protein
MIIRSRSAGWRDEGTVDECLLFTVADFDVRRKRGTPTKAQQDARLANSCKSEIETRREMQGNSKGNFAPIMGIMSGIVAMRLKQFKL